jgi:hypothetical protein
MEFTSRLKGLLDDTIFAGAFDADANESLRRYLPQDQIDLIPVDKRDQYARLAFGSHAAGGYGAAQQRLMEFAGMPAAQAEAAEKARRAAELRGEIDQATNPMYRGMSIAAEQGAPLGPTKLAQNLSQTTAAQLPSIQQAIRIQALGGPALTEAVIKARTPIAIPTGNSISPVTGAVISTPKLDAGFEQDPVTGEVRLARGFLPAQRAVAQQQSSIETQAKFDTEDYVAEQGPNGLVYRGKLSGMTREQKAAERLRANPQPQPGMPQPGMPGAYQPPQQPGPAQQVPGLTSGNIPGRPGVQPAQQGGDLNARLQAAVVAGKPDEVLALETQLNGGRPPQGLTESYKRAQEIQLAGVKQDRELSSRNTVEAVKASLERGMNAADTLDKAYDIRNIIKSGVYSKVGAIPGEWRETIMRATGLADPTRLGNTAALKAATVDALIAKSKDIKPVTNSDMALLGKATTSANDLTDVELLRLSDLVIMDAKKAIKGHENLIKRFPRDRLSAVMDNMDLSITEPQDRPVPTVQVAPAPPVRGPMPPPPGVTAPAAPQQGTGWKIERVK